jgi:predicted DNA-binding protein (MmcQ/YjbR family)
MDESSVANYIIKTFPGVETDTNFGYTFFFYRADHILPFATIASSDNEYESISKLDRPGVFRLNIGISRETFQSLFSAAKVDLGSYDFTALDMIMPHPDYAKQHFICVLSPSEQTFERVRALLTEAYEIAARRFARRSQKNDSSA